MEISTASESFARSYASKENARLAIKKAGLDSDAYKYIIVQLSDGKYSPVFIFSNNLPETICAFHKGFKIVN